MSPSSAVWTPSLTELNVKQYREMFLSMKEAYTAHNAEVALAVALPPSASNTAPLSDSFDSTEEFFSDHNFEYVDVEDTPDEETRSEGPQYGA